MPGKSFKVALNPAVLRWARESAGFRLQEAAERCGRSEGQLTAWESGKRRPEWSALCKLARLYKRSVAALLLPTPPQDTPLPPDFRTLPKAHAELSPPTRLAIRTARWLIGKVSKLEEQLGSPAPFQMPGIGLSQDPEKIAEEYRKRLKLSVAEQTGWKTSWKALRQWRAAVEAQNVFIFQFTMPIQEARGFSLIDRQRAGIVLNQSDAASARIFTLFHEYAHLLLARPGICTPDEGVSNFPQQIETFCNRFAAALLIPLPDFEPRIPLDPNDHSMRLLANRYRVSRYVVLGRMHGLGAVSAQVFHQTRQRWQRQQESKASQARQQKGGLSGTARCLSQRGRPLVSLVVEAAKREVISLNEAASFLGTKLKDYRKLASKGT